MYQRAAQAELLLHAAGQLAGLLNLCEPRQIGCLEQPPDTSLALPWAQTEEAPEEVHVLVNR